MVKENQESTDSTSKPAKVWRFIKTSKGLFPWEDLMKAELPKKEKDKRESKSLAQTLEWLKEFELVYRPFEVEGLLRLIDNCSYYDACVRQVAEDVVGQGWELIPANEEDERIDQAQADKVNFLLNDPNEKEETIENICNKALVDYFSIGWLCLETPRGPDHEINGIYHIPAHTIWVHKSETKFCQIRDLRYRWFKAFGYDKEIHSEDGTEYKTKRGKFNANELIMHKRYYQQSDYYGAPPILPALGAVYGAIGYRDFNLAFFENYGVPAAMILLEGNWEEGSAKQINDFLDVEIKSAQNAHKVMIMELPSGGQITWIPLSVEEKKEGSFQVYFSSMRSEILSVYRMPPYRLAIAEVGALGENVAREQSRIYIDSTVNPAKKAMARLITKLIIRKGLNCDKVAFRFKELDIRDMDSYVERWTKLFGMAAINVNYIRAQMALKPEDHGNTYYLDSKYNELGMETATDMEKIQRAELADIRRLVEAAIKKKE